MSAGLFDMEPTPLPVVEKLSADRRRTLRQARDIAFGRHPVLQLPFHADAARVRGSEGLTCGDCAHKLSQEHHGRTYLKCDYSITSGAATDLRLWWPACVRFEAKP